MSATTSRQGPTLTIVGTCDDCDHLRRGVRVKALGKSSKVACAHPSRSDGGTIFAPDTRVKPVPMPDWCPCLGMARAAFFEKERDTPRTRHVLIVSDTPGIGPVGCMIDPTDKDIENSRARCAANVHFEEVDPATCPVCEQI